MLSNLFHTTFILQKPLLVNPSERESRGRSQVVLRIDNNEWTESWFPFFMSLKAVLFDFNGVIVNDLALHWRLIDEILIKENLQPQKPQERQASLGQSDRAYFQQLLQRRGRVVSDEYFHQLLNYKAQAYVLELEKLEKLPLYAGVEDLIFQVRAHNLKLGIVSGALRKEIDIVLELAKIAEYFHVIVAGDDIATSKPEPEGYLLGVDRFNQKYPDLNLQSQECLAIEDTPAGIEAAKRAQMQVVGVANTYPFHMLQRQANWTVDYLVDLELERVLKFILKEMVNLLYQSARMLFGSKGRS